MPAATRGATKKANDKIDGNTDHTIPVKEVGEREEDAEEDALREKEEKQAEYKEDDEEFKP